MTDLVFKTVEVMREDPAEVKDNRNPIQKMFCDYNKVSGELEALPLHPLLQDDYKILHDCIPLLLKYRGSDTNYSGPLKDKNVLVVGGRRRSRAGTGVEFLLDLEYAEEFVQLLGQAIAAAKQYLNTPYYE